MTAFIEAADEMGRNMTRLRATVRDGIIRITDPEQRGRLDDLGARLDELANRKVVLGLSLEAAATELQQAARRRDAVRLAALQDEFAPALVALPAEIDQAIRELNAIVDALPGGDDADD